MSDVEILDSLTLVNMKYNYKDFLKSHKTQEKTLEAMARIYPNPERYIPALRKWLEETTIDFEGGEYYGFYASAVQIQMPHVGRIPDV